MIKKYISQSGVIIEVGDFYGSGTDEVVSSLEENNNQVLVYTTFGFYPIDLKPGDYIGMQDGSGKVVKSKHDETEASL